MKLDHFSLSYTSSDIYRDRYALMTSGCGCCSDPEELTQENLIELKGELEEALQWVNDRLKEV